MQQQKFNILSNTALTADVYRMWLEGGDAEARRAVGEIRAGQFVNIALEGCFLRRPVSICDAEDGRVCIVYKVVGEGTAMLKGMTSGMSLDLLLPLGNGFDLSAAGVRPLLIGGGVGVPPLLLLAKRLAERGIQADVILGFNSAAEIILAEEFRAAGCDVTIATADGSEGCKGFVTDAADLIGADRRNSYFYACGPKPMLRALQQRLSLAGEMSLEERMGCGFGVCMGCTCKTGKGSKQVCTDGPVFLKDDIIFN